LQRVENPLVVPEKVPELVLLLIENGGEMDPPVQLDVSSVMVEPNWFWIAVYLAVACADAAPAPPIATAAARANPALSLDMTFNTFIVTSSFAQSRMRRLAW
jgi:hypothetical protein